MFCGSFLSALSKLIEQENGQPLTTRNTRNRGKLSGSFLSSPCVLWLMSLCTQQADRARKWTTTDHTEYTESGKLTGFFLCGPCVLWFVSLCTQQADRAREWTTTDHTEYTESGKIVRFLSEQSVCSVVNVSLYSAS